MKSLAGWVFLLAVTVAAVIPRVCLASDRFAPQIGAIEGTFEPATRSVALTFRVSALPYEDMLLAVRSEVSEYGELRSARPDDRSGLDLPLAAIPIQRGVPTTFNRDGYSIVLKGVGSPLRSGEIYPVTLVFLRSGEVPSSFVIGNLAPPPRPPKPNGSLQ